MADVGKEALDPQRGVATGRGEIAGLSHPGQIGALKVEHLSKTFGVQTVLSDVNLHIQRGEVHALLGENGSGKSTLIKIIAGLYLPNEGGRVWVDGRLLELGSTAASRARGLRFVHQTLGIIGELNAVENMAMTAGYLRPGAIDWRAQRAHTEQLLDRLDVHMDLRRPMRELRAIDRCAIAICRALDIDHDRLPVIVMDEPTSFLPPTEVEHLFKIVRELAEAGTAVLYVSHRLDEVFEIATSFTVLRDGHLVGDGRMEKQTGESIVELIVGHQITRAEVSRKAAGARRQFEAQRLQGGAVRSLDLTAAEGEIVGIVGIGGSGREDAARLLIGAVPEARGQIAVAGRPLMPTPRTALEAGIVLAVSNTQEGSAVADFSTLENATLGWVGRNSRAWGVLARTRERRQTHEMVEKFDVRPRDPNYSYKLLSGGNKQKVILSRALESNPQVLILDDPTGGVDVGGREAIYELVRTEASKGLTVIVVSSDLEDIVSLCHRALVMVRGRVVDEVAGDELTENTLLRLSNPERLTA